MTLWSPTYRVTIGGTVVTSVTLAGLTVSTGRTDIYSQPQPGYCNLSLLETNGAAVNYEINQSLTVEVKKTDGTYVYLFGGFITDVGIKVSNSGSVATSQQIDIIAIGSLARLARERYTGSVASANDGDQIASILNGILFNTWAEVSPTYTWATYPATTTWSNAENLGYGTIDQPGDYLLDDLTGVDSDVLSLVNRLAVSGLGYVYEDSRGRINYADSTNRGQYLSANGYVSLNGSDAIGPGLNITKRAGDVRNKVTLTYTGTGASSVSASDTTSIASYGTLANTVSTTLKNLADANSQAAYYLTLRAYPQYQLKSITFEVHSTEISDANRDSLLQVFMGMPVYIANLPGNMAGGAFEGFVEGWTWNAGYNRLRLTLNVSPLSYSVQAFKWSDVSALEAWNTLSLTLTWQNATIVA